jgi:hypothetical protein
VIGVAVLGVCHLGEAPPGELGAVVADQLGERAVDLDEAPLGVGDGDPETAMVEHRAREVDVAPAVRVGHRASTLRSIANRVAAV